MIKYQQQTLTHNIVQNIHSNYNKLKIVLLSLKKSQ